MGLKKTASICGPLHHACDTDAMSCQSVMDRVVTPTCCCVSPSGVCPGPRAGSVWGVPRAVCLPAARLSAGPIRRPAAQHPLPPVSMSRTGTVSTTAHITLALCIRAHSSPYKHSSRPQGGGVCLFIVPSSAPMLTSVNVIESSNACNSYL